MGGERLATASGLNLRQAGGHARALPACMFAVPHPGLLNKAGVYISPLDNFPTYKDASAII